MTKEKNSCSIANICYAVADNLRTVQGAANDLPMIRTEINDYADARAKEGFRVCFRFNQDKAVRLVQKRLKIYHEFAVASNVSFLEIILAKPTTQV